MPLVKSKGKNKLQLVANPYLNGSKTAYYLKFANYLDSEILYSILFLNIVSERFLKVFNGFEQKFYFINVSSSLPHIQPGLNDGWLSGVIDARTSFTFDDFSPKLSIGSHEEFDKFIKLVFYGINFSSSRQNQFKVQGISIKPILDYLNIYNPILQSETFIWFNNYFKTWEQYRNELFNLDPKLSEKGLAKSKEAKSLFLTRNKILRELKLKRPKSRLSITN